MTEEFKEKLEKAVDDIILVAVQRENEYSKKVEFNQTYSNLYLELVIAFVRTFDLHTGYFCKEQVDQELLKKFGHPRRVSAYLVSDTQAIICLDYSDNLGGQRTGEPEFKKAMGFDLEVVNELLAENDINVSEEHVDSYGVGTNDDCISFNASMLIAARNKLLSESKFPKLYKKM